MAEQDVNLLLSNRVSWLADSGPEDDIAISSRIRYARNLETIPFPINAKEEELIKVMGSVQTAIKKSNFDKPLLKFQLSALNELDRQVLLERRLVSTEFSSPRPSSALVVSKDEELGIMINEEDHIRLQTLKSGFQLKEVLKQINNMDDQLSKYLPYVYNKELGFLTSCPTNVGTGMRASVMLHLPGLMLSEQINPVINGVTKLGFAVRGFFGEGSENLGNLYQISNQSTLGESELQIISRLEMVIRQIINHEKNARQNLLETRQSYLMDHVGRAYGVLRHSYIISSQETLNSLSALRMGVDMGMFSFVDIHTVNELFITVQPAHLQKYAEKKINSEERDVLRADLIRERLKRVDK